MTAIRQILSPILDAFPGVPPWVVAVALALVGAALLWLASRLAKWIFVLAALAVLAAGLVVAIRLALGR
jgi:hypothetical protein